MPTASFTAWIDVDLRAELELIARFEERSELYLGQQAIRNFVEERKATRELLHASLALIDREAQGVAPDAVHEWLLANDERAFPGA